MKKNLVVLLGLVLTGSALTSYAEPPSGDREARRAEWQAMSPEEREAARVEARERFQSMSDEERTALREQRRERFESLSPEQQARVRERRAEGGQGMPGKRKGPKNRPQ